MGTTAAMLLCEDGELTLCNVGDSKVFRFSGDDMRQISKDHVSASPFGTKPPLSQNLGIPPDVLLIDPYLSHGRCKDGDRYLLCSDGLTDMLTSDEIAVIVRDNPIGEAATMLVEQALEHGGKDNITVILLEIKRKSRFRFWEKSEDAGV